jgi:hypothetical protein
MSVQITKISDLKFIVNNKTVIVRGENIVPDVLFDNEKASLIDFISKIKSLKIQSSCV